MRSMGVMRVMSFAIWLLAFCCSCLAQESGGAGEKLWLNVPYRDDETLDDYGRSRCVVDVYVPEGVQDFPTIVWFHGGGLTQGEKSIPAALKGHGVAVVAAGYRLNPQVKAPVYIEDAAAAIAWTFRNIAKYGGSDQKIFVSGHSAGGYLTLMTGLDQKWLKAQNVEANRIAGLIPFSGQVITHFTIRDERGIAKTQPLIDEYAPLFHVRKDAPPILLISGDRNKELLGRYEENAYLWRMMKENGHTDTELFELQGFDHGGMAEPAFPLLLKFVKERSKKARP
ncbi:MAG: alpha/beta hydrolase [Planctomycetaceae bacterium]